MEAPDEIRERLKAVLYALKLTGVRTNRSMTDANPTALSPSQLNRQVRGLLESHFDWVWVEGEISNLARPASGHWYFSLKDEQAQVRCAMFRNRNQRLRFRPENGDLVRLRARVSLYEGRGEFQLVGEFMEPAGTGALQARFDTLRDKLRDEGLFDTERKQALPLRCEHLAVITSPTGAALQDILQVLRRRNPALQVTVLPRSVQGDTAPAGLVDAVIQANRLHEEGRMQFDAIVLARGGGSLEDLWAFNDETLARTIAASALPVIVGVGHEVDFTIADFAADVRAPTPSAAAELLSDDVRERMQRLDHLAAQLQRAVKGRFERDRLILNRLATSLRHPGQRLRERCQTVDRIESELRRAMMTQLQQRRYRLDRQAAALSAASPSHRLEQLRTVIETRQQRLHRAAQLQLDRRRQRLATTTALLDGLNPLAILGRGYAILTDAEGSIIRHTQQAVPGTTVQARLADGSLDLEVKSLAKAN